MSFPAVNACQASLLQCKPRQKQKQLYGRAEKNHHPKGTVWGDPCFYNSLRLFYSNVTSCVYIVGNIRSEHSPAIGRGSLYQRGEEEWLEETLVCVESFRAVLL